ncbi:hypothetical protein R3J32_04665 [Xylella fastidiosa subsp. multiplex]|uniref:hypothetical protein n=1 Tax=Xylella fastidiosa TaxID=2371 RepID=UPI0035D51636
MRMCTPAIACLSIFRNAAQPRKRSVLLLLSAIYTSNVLSTAAKTGLPAAPHVPF